MTARPLCTNPSCGVHNFEKPKSVCRPCRRQYLPGPMESQLLRFSIENRNGPAKAKTSPAYSIETTRDGPVNVLSTD